MPLKLCLYLEIKKNILNIGYSRITKRPSLIFNKAVSIFLLNEKGKCTEKGTEKEVMECKGNLSKRGSVRKLFFLLKLYIKK
jgi:hypothetical protein